MQLTLPIDSAERKDTPMASGCLEYFPAALAGVAKHSKMGNDKHNPGEPLNHARGKSTDHADCIVRHLVDIADYVRYLEGIDNGAIGPIEELLAEANALSWRSLALSQQLHERFGGLPLAPRARLPSLPEPPMTSAKVESQRAVGIARVASGPYDKPNIAGPISREFMPYEAPVESSILPALAVQPRPVVVCHSSNIVPSAQCYCGTCARLRDEAATRT